jgi:GT2 family glycosyltransferase
VAVKEIIPNSVALLSPCANSVEPRAYQFAMSLVCGAWGEGYPIRQIGVTERTLIHSARNMLAEQFLETDCEWAFWLDSDMVLPPNTIPVMMRWARKLKAQFLTGIYYQRIGDHKPLVLIRDEEARKYEDEYSHSNICPPEGCKDPFKVHCCGFGAVLMHRDVLAKLARPFFKYGYIGEKKDLSEDFYFCIQAKKAGIPLWAIPELECFHLGQAPLIGRKDFKSEVNTTRFKVETYQNGNSPTGPA